MHSRGQLSGGIACVMDSADAVGGAQASRTALQRPSPLRLDVLDEAGSLGFDEREEDTPRSPGPALVNHSQPFSPTHRKTKSRAAHAFCRSGSFTSRNSLKDSKVIAHTHYGSWCL